MWLPLIREELRKNPSNPYPPNSPKPKNHAGYVPKTQNLFLRSKTPRSGCLKSCAFVLCTFFRFLMRAKDSQQPKRRTK